MSSSTPDISNEHLNLRNDILLRKGSVVWDVYRGDVLLQETFC
jgi:hypothetical protein